MAKNLSVATGAVIAIVGLVLLFVWGYEFMFMLRGIIPGILLLGGGVIVIAGLSELKDKLKSKVKK